MSLTATLAKPFAWFGKHILGDAAVDVLKEEGIKMVKNKLTRKDLILGVIYTRLGMIERVLTPAEIQQGLNALNEFYASLSRAKRDLFERLFFRDVRDAIQDLFLQPRTVFVDGKYVDMVKRDPDGEADMMRAYLAHVGLAGDREIRLEMEKLYQASPTAQIKKAVRTADRKVSGALDAFLKGVKEG